MTIHFRVKRDLREPQPGGVCRADRALGAAAARKPRPALGDYPDTLPVSFPTVPVREVRSGNKAGQSLGRWRDIPR